MEANRAPRTRSPALDAPELYQQAVVYYADVRGALAGRGGVGRVVRAGEETAEERGAVPQLVRNQSLDLRAEMSRRRHRARARIVIGVIQ